MIRQGLLLIFVLLLIGVHTGRAGNDLRFIENKGQWKGPFQYKTDLPHGAMFIEKDGFTFHFAEEALFGHYEEGEVKERYGFHAHEMKFLNANPDPVIKPFGSYDDYMNFYLGREQKRWKSKVKSYRLLKYEAIYPGTELKVYTYGGSIKYDFLVSPQGDPRKISMQYNGAENLFVDEKTGNLVIHTSLDTIMEKKPYAYHIIDGEKTEVPCRFKLKNKVLSFEFPEGYNKELELIIDPVLIFASYSGSTADNFGMTATPGNDGSLFAGGMAYALGYPTTTGAYDSTFAGPTGNGITDVVITRYDPTGATLLYSTYIGGTGTETVHSLIVNDKDELYLYGSTSSSDFPTTSSAYDSSFNGGNGISFTFNGTTFNGGTDIYIAKLNPTGTSLLGSTYAGGSANDGVSYNVTSLPYNGANTYDSLTTNYGDQFRGEVMLDNSGNCLIASTTRSSDFPIVNGFQSTFQGQQDGVVFKLDSSLSNMMWSTYLGGSDKDAAYSLKVDDLNNVFVTGGTASSDFPSTSGVLNPAYLGGKTDGYISKIKNDGSALLRSTFIGTSAYDQSFFLEIDRLNNIFIVGQSLGSYPVTPGVYSNPSSPQFVSKLDSGLSSLQTSTIFGNGNNSSINISPAAFLVDRCGNIYVSGWGANILQSNGLSGMPLTANAHQSSTDGFDFYLIVFETNFQSLLYATYFGGNVSQEHVDGGTSRFDDGGVVYQSVCAGCGGNDDFPTTPGAHSSTNNSSNCNNGVFKFDFEIAPDADFTASTLEGCAPLTVQFTDQSSNADDFYWDFGGGDTTGVANPVRTYSDTGTFRAYLIITDSSCNVVDTALKIITVHPSTSVDAGNSVTTCDSAVLVANDSGGVTRFIWSSNSSFSDTLNGNLQDSTITVFPTDTTYYYVKAENDYCSSYDSVLVNFTGIDVETGGDTIICEGTGADMEIFAYHQNNSPPFTYEWTPPSSIISGANTSSPLVSPTQTTTYNVVVTNNFGCSDTGTVTVTILLGGPDSVYAFAEDDTILTGESTTLYANPSSGYNYLWEPGGSLTQPNSSTTGASPSSTTTYKVTVTDKEYEQCFRTAEVTVYVTDGICGEPDIFVPNAFSPNDDGENDVLYVRGSNIDEMYFTVYDRWGELIFETKDQDSGWDGTHKGKEVDPAVYVYYLRATCIDQQEYFKKGNITVIR